MKVVSVIPIKMNNERVPGKNTKQFDDGTPLIKFVQNTLISVKLIEEIYVFCSNEQIRPYLLDGVQYLKRSCDLDRNTTSITEVLTAFSNFVDADIYVLAHATAPFIKKESIEKGLSAVLSGVNDSAFSVKKLSDFIWMDGQPLNYKLDMIPRTQDLPDIYAETSGFYIYRKEVIQKYNRRIGNNPYMIEVDGIESIDIDEPVDFAIANSLYMHGITNVNADV